MTKVLRRCVRSTVFIPLIAGLLVSAGCRKDSGESLASEDDRVVIQLGDSVLMESEVYARIPAGITSEDSMLLYDAVVQNWLEKRLLLDVASLNLPAIERIEKMVDDYRLQLITNEYRRVMAESNLGIVSPEEVKEYYQSHRDQLRLQYPLVKGVYVKVSGHSKMLSDIRRWLSSDDTADIEQLEKYGLNGAMQYDDFRDTWVSWKSLSELVPWRFEPDNGFLTEGFLFDKKIGSSVYMMRITEVIPAGEIMPYEFASNEIARILADRKRSSYDSDLLRNLYNEAVRSKKLQVSGYVPMKFRFAEVNSNDNKKNL